MHAPTEGAAQAFKNNSNEPLGWKEADFQVPWCSLLWCHTSDEKLVRRYVEGDSQRGIGEARGIRRDRSIVRQIERQRDKREG